MGSYQGGVYTEQGTGNLVCPTGATIRVESGGTMELASGATLTDGTATVVTTTFGQKVRLLSATTMLGTPLAASAVAATDPTPSIGSNNAPSLTGTASQNNTKLNNALFEVVLDQNYQNGEDVTVHIAAGYTLSSGTSITATVDLVASLCDNVGAAGSDLCTTAAQAITATSTEYGFTLTGTTLTRGARLVLEVTTSVAEAGNTGTATGHIYGLRLS
jgi:hypothetical protein